MAQVQTRRDGNIDLVQGANAPKVMLNFVVCSMALGYIAESDNQTGQFVPFNRRSYVIVRGKAHAVAALKDLIGAAARLSILERCQNRRYAIEKRAPVGSPVF